MYSEVYIFLIRNFFLLFNQSYFALSYYIRSYLPSPSLYRTIVLYKNNVLSFTSFYLPIFSVPF